MLRKNIITGILCCLLGSNILADSFSFSSRHTSTHFSPIDTTVILEAMVKNLSNRDINIQGIRNIIQMPDGWASRMCFGNCFGDSVDETDVITLWANDSMEFELDIDVIGSQEAKALVDITMKSGIETHKLSFEVSTLSNSNEKENQFAYDYWLYNNYPNPFNPTTNIEYSISKNQFVKINIFDITGKNIKTLVNENKTPGNYHVKWNGTNFNGNIQPTGVYYYQLEMVNNQSIINSISKKMVLLK